MISRESHAIGSILIPYLKLRESERPVELTLEFTLDRKSRRLEDTKRKLFVKYAVGTDTITHGYKFIRNLDFNDESHIVAELREIIKLPGHIEHLNIYLTVDDDPKITALFIPEPNDGTLL